MSAGREAFSLRWKLLGKFLALLVAGGTPNAIAAERLSTQRAAFQQMHPCPSTGKARGACPGYVVDHVRPLCAGGRDHPGNMQWQTVAEAKLKDQVERRECAQLRRSGRS